MERFEERVLLAINPLGPKLVAVIPNAGDILEENQVEILNIAPSELLFRFSEGQEIDPAANNLSKIQIVRGGSDGKLGTSDDVSVGIGWIGMGDFDNEVIVRFASTLPDDVYQITIDKSFENLDSIEAGENQTRSFELDLGARVIAVVPQPVTRNASGVLQQARDKIEVYFNADALNKASAETVGFYQLIGTNDTADPSDDTATVNPTSVVYDSLNHKAVLTFAGDLDSLLPTGTALRLRIGNRYSAIQTTVLNPEVVDAGPLGWGGATQLVAVAGSAITDGQTFSIDDGKNTIVFEFEDAGALNGLTSANHVKVLFRTSDLNIDVAESVADAINFASYWQGLYASASAAQGIVTLTSGEAGDSFYLAQGVGSFGQGSTGQSVIITGEIAPTEWDDEFNLEWAGALEEPGHRDLPNQPDVLVEDHYMSGDSSPDGSAAVPTYSYCFPNSPANLITEAQKERTREIFALYSMYLGVNFYESESGGIAVMTGDLALLQQQSGPGGIGGLGGNGIALMDYAEDWGDSEFGGAWFQVAMHEIGHVLGYGHSYDLPTGTIMGSNEDVDGASGGAEPVFPGDNDIVHGTYMYNLDGSDIDLYRFEVNQRGTFSAEILAERRDYTSFLDSQLTLYQEYQETKNGIQVTKYREIAQNDDFYSEDSFLELYLREGTYYIAVTSSGNTDFDAGIENSGANGNTQGSYDLRLSFVPGGVDPDDPETFVGAATQQIVDAERGVVFDGDADGVPGGAYDFWFNLQDEAHTLFVDKASTALIPDGSLASPYKTIPEAFAAAEPGDIVRIVGNNFEDDDRWNEITAVAGSKITDGQTFSISDATQTVVFEFDRGDTVSASHVRVPVKSTDSASTVAAAISQAIATARDTLGLKVGATVSGSVVTLTDSPLAFDRGNTLLTTPLNNNIPYEIGYGKVNNTPLSDGTKMEIPQGVTVMIDAGAVFKLRKANIDVGSSATGIDRSSGVLQVLGTPDQPVYFTSHYDETLGVDTEPTSATTAKGGDWGGLVFRNDLDYDFMAAYDPADGNAPRTVLERQGIFLNYVNHASLRYGGGEVIVNSEPGYYAPIHLVESRPTVTCNTIAQSAHEAMSADPNSFADTRFQSWDYSAPFTLGYDRVGPEIHGNTVVDNSINGILVRIRTNAGRPIDELEVCARFDDTDIVHVIPENLFVNGTAGGGYNGTSTTSLRRISLDELQAVTAAEGLIDAETFSIFDGTTRVVFEFDQGEANGCEKGHVPIFFSPTDSAATIAQAIAGAINNARQKLLADLGLDVDLNVTATVVGDVVRLESRGTTLVIDGVAKIAPRLDARLMIDPGMVVKLDGSRIEVEIGAQLIAEGRSGSVDGAPASKVVFTSLFDDRYGAAGTFDTTRDGDLQAASPGNWGGIYFSPNAEGSLDYAVVAYAGGVTAIEGGFASFNPIEIRQAHVRITNSRFENNAIGALGGDRNGRAQIAPGTISIRGAQPIIVGNDFINDAGPVITIDVNAMKSTLVTDWGRSTGAIDAYEGYSDNVGPMVRENRMTNNQINGMEVRGATLTTEVIWDDVDIVHVLRGEIVVSNFHHYGGIRLQSSSTQSLVVKLWGDDAGITATGDPLEIDDRIGGTVQILGASGHPVVLTSLADDSVGAGFDLRNRPQFDTNNNGASEGSPGDWGSVTLDEYSNDRNVAVVNEKELASGNSKDTNNDPTTEAEFLGYLAESEEDGDDVLRLGFQIHGHISTDDASDVDVYRFQARPGTEVWIEIDRTSYALDTILELVDADGNVLARSDNSTQELEDSSLLFGLARSMNRDPWLEGDMYTVNARDAGMRVVLPGSDPDKLQNYYVRVRSSLAIGNLVDGKQINDGSTFSISDGSQTVVFEFDKNGSYTSGRIQVAITDAMPAEAVATAIVNSVTVAHGGTRALQVTARVLNGNVVLDGAKVEFSPQDTPLTRLAHTSGTYQLQVRLGETQEVPGSTVQYADILYSTDGIEILGLPSHSPLTGETADIEGTTSGANNTQATAQEIGNLLASNQNTLGVAGYLAGRTDVDWYEFEVDYAGIQSIPNINDSGSIWATIFDIDYADGMARPDTSMWVFDDAGRLILMSHGSNVVDDRPAPGQGTDLDDLTRGSVGTADPYIGTVYLPEKRTYYVAITSRFATSNALSDPLARVEPIDSVERVVEEHIDSGPNSYIPADRLALTPDEFQLGDVVMYVNTSGDLYTVDPYTGAFETDVTNYGVNYLPGAVNSSPYLVYNDIAMRNDGQLYTITGHGLVGSQYANRGQYRRLSTEDARNLLSSQDDGIITYEINGQVEDPALVQVNPLSADAGVEFQAMAYDPSNATRQVYMVGTMGNLNLTSSTGQQPAGLGTLIDYSTRNLIYAFDSNGRAVTHPNSTGGERLGTDIVPLGQLMTALTLSATGATVVGPTYTDVVDHIPGATVRMPDGDILDGMSFTLTSQDGMTLEFEFDCGYDVRMDPLGPRMVRDGETFTLSDGTKSVVFEFDSGRVLEVDAGSQFADGDRFLIYYVDADGNTQGKIFEYNLPPDAAGTVATGNTAIEIQSGSTVAEVLLLTVNAINTALGGVGVQATYFAPTPGQPGRISLTGETRIDVIQGNGLTISGEYDTTDPNHVAIPFEETQTEQSFIEGTGDPADLQGLQPIVENELPSIRVGYAHRTGADGNTRYGDRLTFYNADYASFQASGAYAYLRPAGADNDLRISATTPGTALNGVVVEVISDEAADIPVINYDAGARRLTFTIDLDSVNTAALRDAINAWNAADPVAHPFRADLDTTYEPLNTGIGLQAPTAVGVPMTGGVEGVASFTVIPGSGPGISGDVAIPFDAGDSSVDVAEAITTAINTAPFPGYNVSALTDGYRVTFSNVRHDPANSIYALANGSLNALYDPSWPGTGTHSLAARGNGPMLVEGSGPNGDITGLAYIGSQAYAVDDAGGFYRVTNLSYVNLGSAGAWGFTPVDPANDMPEVKGVKYNAASGPKATHVATLTYQGQPIQFSGLANAPLNVEDGRYADMLFATDSSGRLFAINADGELQPIFLNGATAVQLTTLNGTPLTDVQGVAFSPIDYNLWHQTNYRGTDAGHGIETTYDYSRHADVGYRIQGQTSYYFGLEDPRLATTIANQPGASNFYFNSTAGASVYQTYDMPGGAHGSLTSGTFSLVGYSAADMPTLYFTYFAETQNSANYDGLRVYISSDGASWSPLASNTDRDDANFGRICGVDIVDVGDSWRQARISLAGYAGADNLRLRFDFSTASDMHVGDNENTGVYLSAVPANELRDGGAFTLDGNTTFEFDLGYAFLVPNAPTSVIADGQYVVVRDRNNDEVTFEFDKNGSVAAGHVAISLLDQNLSDLSAADLATRIVQVIRGSGLAVTPILDGSRVFLDGATDAEISAGLQAWETASNSDRVILEGNAPGKVGSTHGVSHVPVPLHGNMDAAAVAEAITQTVNHYISGLRIQTLAGRDIGDGATFYVSSDNGTTRTVFEFDKGTGQVVPGSVLVQITDTTPAADVALAIRDAIAGAGLNVLVSCQDELVTLLPGEPTAVVAIDLDVTGLTQPSTVETALKQDADLGYLIHLVGHTVTRQAPGYYSVTTDAACRYSQLGYSGHVDGTNGVLPGDHPSDKMGRNVYGPPNNDRFNLLGRGQNNNYEGWYIDDIIIGFAERGEMVTGVTTANTTFTIAAQPTGDTTVVRGDYQLEIRRGEEYGTRPTLMSPNWLMITDSFDTNDRLAQGFTLLAPAAEAIVHGQTFTIGDGVNPQKFKFLDRTLDGGGGGAIPIYFQRGQSASSLAASIVSAVNSQSKIEVIASALSTSNRVDLFGATAVTGIDFIIFGAVDTAGSFSDKRRAVERDYEVTVEPMDLGDRNVHRAQGQVVINGNRVMYAENYGITVAPSERDAGAQWPYPGSPRVLGTKNNAGLVPGITIQNNVVAYNETGGIYFGGHVNQDADGNALPTGAVPFGRIINNTIYGVNDETAQDAGIRVANNASPTLLNNIVANCYVGLDIDGSSRSTVVGATVYQNNGDGTGTSNSTGTVGSFALELDPDDPLFVDPTEGVANFYLANKSEAIDSSVNTLPDRPELVVVKTDLGIAESPILAPDYDLYGQYRIDDPKMDSPPGWGSNVFKDRGAIDRVDFLGPTSQLIDPLDNDADGVDRDEDLHDVTVAGVNLFQFAIQLSDTGGTGIADSTVLSQYVQVEQDGVLLVDQVDYLFEYDSTNDVIYLLPMTGIWTAGSSYKIILVNQGIRDIADNALQPNRSDDTTYFTISVAGMDYGDAPDTGVAPNVYPSLAASDGARHVIVGSYLGSDAPSSEPESRQNSDASGDSGDDGVVFLSPLLVGGTTTIEVTASGPGYLEAWIDFTGPGGTRDGVWDNSPGSVEHVIVSEQWTAAGTKTLTINVPAGITGTETFARFRFSSIAGLGPTGEASDGEVEDYRISMIDHLEDFGDAPSEGTDGTAWFPTTLAQNGARHRLTLKPEDGLYIGVRADAESDGQPTLGADGDDLTGTLDDEEGSIQFLDPIVPGGDVDVQVFVTLPAGVSSAFLQGWIDFNGDHNWGDAAGVADAGEQILLNEVVHSGLNALSFSVPASAVKGLTYARFRLSTQADLSYVGSAVDGEVEDYTVSITAAPQDFGDAPSPYPTLQTENGARHTIVPGGTFCLGSLVDFESNGQPSAAADGDDGTGDDDEDGVVAFTEIRTGGQAQVTVTATIPAGDEGFLSAWIDFNGDGDWNDTWTEGATVISEQIIVDASLSGNDPDGAFTFTFAVPRNLTSQEVAARFRFSHTDGLGPTTPADADDADVPDGEVEDYMVQIVAGDSSISGYKFNDLNADGVWQETNADVGNILLPAINWASPGELVIASSDDGYSWRQSFGFNFEFFGRQYDSFYVNNNGNITLGWTENNQQQGWPLTLGTPVDLALVTVPMIAPFWADADTTATGTVHLQHGTSSRGNPFVQIDWIGVGYASGHSDRTDTFSLYIEDDAGGDIVAFSYNADGMQWTSADTSGGTAGFGGAPALVGFTDGNGNYVTTAEVATTADLADLGNVIAGQPKYAFRFDPMTGELVGKEPGLAGCRIYLDTNGNGVYDDGIDQWTVTDATGYYEFTNLFPGTYHVGEFSLGGDWVQTFPDPLTADGLHTITLGADDSRTDVNFGNYLMAQATVSDVVLTEGNSGTTEVKLTLTVTGSFGAPVTVHYHTADGTATVADGDYRQVLDGTYTFVPQATPVERWAKSTLTHNTGSDYEYRVSGDFIVWEGHDGHDWEIFVYDGTRITQLTNNEVDDRYVSVAGDYIAWSRYDGHDYEIMLYDGTTTVQLTNNEYDDKNTELSTSYLTWLGNTAAGTDVFVYKLTGGVVANVSATGRVVSTPRISGDYVVWSASDGLDQEIYLWNGTTWTGASEQTAQALDRQLTFNNRLDQWPDIDGNLVVWEGVDDQDSEIYLYEIGAGTIVRQLTTDTDGTSDTQPQVSDGNIVWTRTSTDGPDSAEIAWFNPTLHTTFDPTINQLTFNGSLDAAPRVYGDHVVWQRRVSTTPVNYEVYYYNLATGSAPINLSGAGGYDWYPQVSDNYVVWRNYDGNDYEIVVAERSGVEATQTITLLINGDTKFELDEDFRVILDQPNLAYLVDAEGNVQSQLEARIDVLNDDGTLDYGDAPQSGYATLLSDNGARHRIVSGFYLGTRVDAEVNGQPNSTASGDDAQVYDDEDGVTFDTALVAGGTAMITVTAARPSGIAKGYLDAWIDFNRDGDWDDEGEKLVFANGAELQAGTNTLTFNVPETAQLGNTFARFRYSSTGGLASFGTAADGEVEDYMVAIGTGSGGMVLKNRTLTVTGDATDDVFSLSGDTTLLVTLNGKQHSFPAADVDKVVFDGKGGNNRATITGSTANETFTASPSAATMSRTGLLVTVTGARTITFEGGGGTDQATITGTTADETILAAPLSASLSGANGQVTVTGVKTILVGSGGGADRATITGTVGDDSVTGSYESVALTATAGKVTVTGAQTVVIDGAGGNNDVVDLYDSPDGDTVTTSPGSFVMNGSAYSITANNFEVGNAYSTAGGTDVAFMYDSPFDDYYAAGPDFGRLLAGTSDYRVNSFDYVHVFGKNGGYDRARLEGSVHNDVFVTNERDSSLYSDGRYFHRTWYFEDIVADGASGGYDFTLMRGTTGDDVFTGSRTIVSLVTGSANNRARGFELVNVFGRGGNDEATLWGYGGDDTYSGEPAIGRFYGKGFDMRLRNFDYIHAYAGAGGTDVAYLNGTSDADTFEGTPSRSILTSPGYKHDVEGFHRVYADGLEGNDTALLNDSAGDDHLEAAGNKATVSTADLAFLYSIEHFESAKAKSSTGKNTKTIQAIDFLLDHDEWL